MSVYPSVHLSVRPSVISQCSTETAKRRITQTTLVGYIKHYEKRDISPAKWAWRVVMIT